MTVFEYVMVLVSIIVGLAVARMLDGVLLILRGGRPYRTFWIHSLWVGITFFELVGHWAYRWSSFQTQPDWTLFELLFFLLPTVLLFLAAGLLFPEGEPAALESYYFGHRRPFLAAFIGLWVLYSLETWWVLDMGMGNRGDLIRATLIGLCVPLLVSRRVWLHAALTIAVVLVILGVRLPLLGGDWGRFTG